MTNGRDGLLDDRLETLAAFPASGSTCLRSETVLGLDCYWGKFVLFQNAGQAQQPLIPQTFRQPEEPRSSPTSGGAYQLPDRSRAVGKTPPLEAQDLGVREPQVGQGCSLGAVKVLACLQSASS